MSSKMKCLLLFTIVVGSLLQAETSSDRGLLVKPVAPDGQSAIGKQYLFVIAINNYLHWSPLAGPVPEAHKLKQVLVDRYAFTEQDTIMLLDGEATRERILRQLRWYLQNIEPHDSLLVLFCGHGHLDDETKLGFLVPVNGGLDVVLQDNWISYSTLHAYLGRIPSRHILFIADSCYSGAMLDLSRGLTPEIKEEYFQRAYKFKSRQVLTSGSVETVTDSSTFGEALYDELLANRSPYLDPLNLFVNIRAAVRGQQPLLGALRDAGHQEGGSFIFFLTDPDVPSIVPSRPTVTLAPASTGTVRLQCRLNGALSIDGVVQNRVEAGLTYVLAKVPAGRDVRLQILDQDAEWTKSIWLQPGQELKVTADPPASRVEQAAPGKRLDIPGLEFSMQPIPAGAFTMGSGPYEGGRGEDEDRWTVQLEKPFWMAEHEVTNAVYSRFRELSGYDGRDDADNNYLRHLEGDSILPRGANYPVCYVSWFNAVAFCQWLTTREKAAGRLPAGYVYRLPTEAEWEYACRAGSEEPYHGDLATIGWYQHNSNFAPAEAGRKKANRWGLHDMHGNVREWCYDWYDAYARETASNPQGPANSPVGNRVARGGSWQLDADRCRSASRFREVPLLTTSELGFRVVLAPPLSP